MRISLKNLLFFATPLLAFTLTGQAWSQGEPANEKSGAELYQACTPCHSTSGGGIAGLPVPELLTKMKHYQTGTFDKPKVQGMQAALKPMTDQQLQTLAAHITKM